jgi:hypothetical protein
MSRWRTPGHSGDWTLPCCRCLASRQLGLGRSQASTSRLGGCHRRNGKPVPASPSPWPALPCSAMQKPRTLRTPAVDAIPILPQPVHFHSISSCTQSVLESSYLHGQYGEVAERRHRSISIFPLRRSSPPSGPWILGVGAQVFGNSSIGRTPRTALASSSWCSHYLV